MGATPRGRVIFLNGTSSAGKTTVARAIQEISGLPYLYTGLDSQFAMVPPKWGGGRGGPLSGEGFRYVHSEEDGHPVVTIAVGPVGRRYDLEVDTATAGPDQTARRILEHDGVIATWSGPTGSC